MAAKADISKPGGWKIFTQALEKEARATALMLTSTLSESWSTGEANIMLILKKGKQDDANNQLHVHMTLIPGRTEQLIQSSRIKRKVIITSVKMGLLKKKDADVFDKLIFFI